jgi:hypothetical protein
MSWQGCVQIIDEPGPLRNTTAQNYSGWVNRVNNHCQGARQALRVPI